MAAPKVELFSVLHFSGRRFAAHSLPLSVVGELGLYEKAVTSASRFIFFNEHRNRRRVALDVELFLAGIDPGSALVRIDRLLPELESFNNPGRQGDLFPPEDEKGRSEFIQAGRDLVLEMVHSSGKLKAVDAALKIGGPLASSSFNLVTSLVGLGDSLGEDEELGVRLPKSAKDEVVITPSLSEELRTRYKIERTAPQEVSLIGSIRMADRDRNSYNMMLQDGTRVRVDAPPMFFQDLKKSLNAEEDKPVWVEVRGVGQYRRQKLHRIVATNAKPLWSISLKETPTSSLSDQLKLLGALEEGWGEHGDEPPISKGTLSLCRTVLRSIATDFGVPTPYLYPTTKGVHAEWPGQRWNAALEITEESLKLILIPVKGVGNDSAASSVLKFDPAAHAELGELLAERLSEAAE